MKKRKFHYVHVNGQKKRLTAMEPMQRLTDEFYCGAGIDVDGSPEKGGVDVQETLSNK
jgi:hypothetical protein